MKKTTAEKVIQIEEQLGRGETDLKIGVHGDEAPAVISHFLRAYRSRTDLAEIMPRSNDFSSQLERMRNFLASGDLVSADSLLQKMKAGNDFEAAELALETFRLRFFQGRQEEALSISESLLENPYLSEISRMTCYQLRGSLFLQRKEYEQAIDELKLAATLAEIYVLASSAFSTRAFLVQAYVEVGKVTEAQDTLESLRLSLSAIAQSELWLDRLLTVIRAECHFYRVTKNFERWKSAAFEGSILSDWIGDRITKEKCEKELRDNLISVPFSATLFSGWAFLPERGLVLHMSPKKIIRVEHSPVALKIFTLLSGQALPADMLFEKVYGFRFSTERHSNHLRAILSKLRRLLPAGALAVKDGIISLK